MSHSVFLIDDDDAVRDALLTLFRGQGIRARGFSSGADFFANLPEATSACVITDVRMPDMDGGEVVRRLSELKGHAWPVIVITGYAEIPMAVQMMKVGVVDFIEKPFDPNRLLEVVDGCLRNLTVQDRERDARQAQIQRLQHLTERERQVFQSLVNGLSNKQIAMALELSPRTVEVYRAKVMDKMQADSVAALVRMGLTVLHDDQATALAV